MHLKRILYYSFTLLLLATSLTAQAALQKEDPAPNELMIEKEDNIFVPDTALQKANKTFSFDWNNDSSITTNKDKVQAIEGLVRENLDLSKVKNVDKQPLGELNYKLGAFYTHITHQADLAIPKLEQANLLLTDADDKAWIDGHLAYAYELKFAANHQIADKERALYYVDKVIINAGKNLQTKQVAFAYCIQGLVQKDSNDYVQAETSFRRAIKIYEEIPDGMDTQYARAENRLATVILAQNNRDKDATIVLEELKKYWLSTENFTQNPYAARNFLALGAAYLKAGNAKSAHEEFNRAMTIYQNVYGNNSPMLIQPYQLQAASYQKLGEIKQAQLCLDKAKVLN